MFFAISDVIGAYETPCIFFLLTTSHGKSNLPLSSSEGSKVHKINCLVHAFFTFSFYNNMRARVQKLIIYSETLGTTHLHHQVLYQDNCWVEAPASS